jgi:hypothetical protein
MPIVYNDRDIISLPNADLIVDPVTFKRYPIGGGRFQEEQRAPFALTGLIVRSGTLIDAVMPLFQELKKDGSLGEEITGQRYGGLGGGERKIVKQGYVVIGLSLYQGLYIDQVAILWQRWTAKGLDNGDTDKSSYTGGVGGGPEEIRAQPGHIAIGIHGKSGTLVDRISLITARPSFS